MHGYQIIQELTERSGGTWTPSAGSIYPALQLLADEGLIAADESGGKKVFHLTDAGHAAATDAADQPAPWEASAPQWPGRDMNKAYLEEAGKLMGAVFRLGKGGVEQTKAATEILRDARKRLYAILAED